MADEGLFTTELVVQIGDINYGNHVGNDRFLLYFHEARLRFLARLGGSEVDLGGGVGLIMTEASVLFRSQARYGDVLEARVWISEAGRARFTMKYAIANKATGALVAEGHTIQVAFDYASNRIARLPEDFLSKLVIKAG